MAADLARDVASMARAARDDKDGHEGLIRQLEHLQPRIDGILARVNDDGSDQHANDLRRWVVVLVTRIAAAAHAEAPRGADVVELVGAAHAPQAVVNAFDELDNELERWAVCLEDLTLPTAYYLNDEDDDAPIAIRAKVFGGRASAIAKALLDAKILPKLFERKADDAALTTTLAAVANTMTRATAFQAKLRRHVACDCGDVAIVILDMLERCCVDCDARKWLRLMTLTRVLVVITFKLRAARKSVCQRNPTEKLLNICGPFRGEGSLVALLIKLNTNIDGGFGPSWKRDAEAHMRLLGDAAASLDSTAREMLRRHMALHDDVPVNRGGRAWPIFSKLVAARSSPRAEAKAASPRSSCGSMDSRDSWNGSPDRMRAPQNTPAKATSPTNTFDDFDGAGRPVRIAFCERLAKALGDVREDLSDGTPSPPKLAPPKTLYTPHRLPPLAQAAPEAYLCALTKALMDEPVRIPGTALAVDRCALGDRVASGNRTWPVTDAPLDADPEDLDVDEDLAREISKYKFQALLPKGPPLVPEPVRFASAKG
ncbi:unnamed protein product [Pelagomonas calceolata]|uniref:U-box domain-containing protein n=1 Tax=Pelagomonas calceolata TaxID=35677 RepID=A0A8J2SWN8_9STRA|nr:unnamed protein product [Pelagomonas calceolata]